MPAFIHKILPAVAPVALTGLMMGCASAPPATAHGGRAAGLEAKVGALQARTASQAGLIGELEARLALLESEARSERRQKPRETVVISGENRRQRREERDHASRGGNAPVKLVLDGRRRAAARAAKPLPPLPSGQVPGLGVVPLPGARADVPHAAVAPKEQYRSALALMRARDYDGTIAALDIFMQKHPQHTLAGSALHWKGEALYAKRDYSAALATFNDVVQRHPTSAKRSAALLKVGLCHRRLGDEELARAIFRRVRQEFPESDAARVASGEGAS